MDNNKAWRIMQAVLLVLAIAAVPVLSGGYGRREVEDTAFVLALGFDRAPDGQVAVTSQVAIPAKAKEGGGGGGDLPVMVVTNTGRTVAEALQQFALSSNKEPFWGHVRVAVFGEEIAREGIAPVLDFLARNHESRVLMWTAVTTGRASDILAAKAQTENLPAMFLSGLISQSRIHSLAPMTTLFDTLREIDVRTGDPVLPLIDLVQPGTQIKPGESGGGGQSSGGSGEQQAAGEDANPVRLEGAGVFRDDKLVGFLDTEQSRGLQWLRGGVRNTIVTFADPTTGASGALRVFASRRSVVSSIDFADISRSRFRVRIEADAYFIENTGGPDVLSAEGRTAVENAAAAVIRNEAMASLDIVQHQYRADVLELGEQVRRRMSNAAWEQVRSTWFDALSDVQVEVTVDLKLRRPGLLTGRVGLGRR
ncbi:MAG: Ger(x)C family spore germination protein [Chloroflexota bacterium]